MLRKPAQPAAEDARALRARLRSQHRLPCGVPECVQCHKGCGVAMSAYLGGLEDNEIAQPTAKRKPTPPAV